MTDPMTSMEIEDVLSSIRRLVSEDLRPGSAATGKASGAPEPLRAVAPPLDGGKLLLTPALRVVPVEAPLPEPAAEIIPEAPFIDVPFSDAEGRGTVVARIGAQVSDDWDAELETTAGHWPAASWEPEVREVDLETVEEAEVLDVTSVEEARLEQAWRDGAWPDERRDAAEDELLAPEEPALTEDPAAVLSAPQDASALTEAALTEAAALQEIADLAEAAVMAEIEAADTLAAAASTAPSDVFAPQDSEDFDEEALREVVRDIIREELQGALGERITRNVRKLVRAEINRALASRDLT